MEQNIELAANEVYNELGPGHSESVYQMALAYELKKYYSDILTEITFPIMYKGKIPVGFQRVDIVVSDSSGNTILIELKAVQTVSQSAIQQVQRYIKYYNLSPCIGCVLINFGKNVPECFFEFKNVCV